MVYRLTWNQQISLTKLQHATDWRMISATVGAGISTSIDDVFDSFTSDQSKIQMASMFRARVLPMVFALRFGALEVCIAL